MQFANTGIHCFLVPVDCLTAQTGQWTLVLMAPAKVTNEMAAIDAAHCQQQPNPQLVPWGCKCLSRKPQRPAFEVDK